MEMDDYLESFWDSLFYEISTYPIIVHVIFVYCIQIIILVIGLAFNLFKTKQTVKYLIIPFGFLLILVNKYKQLK